MSYTECEWIDAEHKHHDAIQHYFVTGCGETFPKKTKDQPLPFSFCPYCGKPSKKEEQLND